MKKPVNVVVAGDVDSGKSTLIGRFLYESGSLRGSKREGTAFAHFLDSLEEERRDDMTIETTQVFCRMKRGPGFIFIDVPGHRELTGNMISGTSYADTAVLVVDANGAIAGQTIRHISILKFLGVGSLAVAVNKMDNAGFSRGLFQKISGEIAVLLRETGLSCVCMVPVSAIFGDNLVSLSPRMPWYEGPTLAAALDISRKDAHKDVFRLCVQDIYPFRNGLVAAGKVISGRVSRGEDVMILPSRSSRRVNRIIQGYCCRRDADRGENIGIVLDDMRGICRGQIICKPPYPGVYDRFPVRLLLVRPGNTPQDDEPPALRINNGLKLRCLSQEAAVCAGEISGQDGCCVPGRALCGYDIVDAFINTRHPVVLEKETACGNSLARFILQDGSGTIVAIGHMPL